MSNDTFQDFCQAWTSRFPNSELPAAWEEDVRANLAKHQAQVECLKEELEKEEMYVEYLDKLLTDIELHRQQKSNSGNVSIPSGGEDTDNETHLNHENGQRSMDYTVTSGSPDNKQQFLEDQCELHSKTKAFNMRASLHLDLEAVNGTTEQQGIKGSQFVTVINVTSPDKDPSSVRDANDSSQEVLTDQPGSKFTYTKSKSKKTETDASTLNGHSKKVPPKLPTKPIYRRQGSKESLNSISSPLSPTSPMLSPSENLLLSPREAPASPREHALIVGGDTSSETSPTNTKQGKSKPDPPQRSISIKDSLHETKSNSSSEDIDLHTSSHSRGRPDGGETDENYTRSAVASDITNQFNKVKDLRANWENKPPIGIKPTERKSKRDSSLSRDGCTSPPVARRGISKSRKDSDSSSRGRMGSPSGKSHDSSDSEHSWGRRNDSDNSPSSRRRASGETRLDRLVRRPSGDKSIVRQLSNDSLPPALPRPKKMTKKWGNEEAKDKLIEEPLYDTVANEEPEDDYDNHLLYTTNLTDTVRSGNSSTDLGFEEPLKSTNSGLSLTGSGTLSSSTDTDGFSGSPSLIKKVVEMDDEESNYVNIQYFLHHTKRSNSKLERDRSLDPFDESEDELQAEKKTTKVDSGSLRSNGSRETSSSEAERVLMYKHILNSIVDSEAIYLECLSVSLQYMKAMKVTLTTAQPVIPKDDFDIIFFKVPELHEFHYHFHDSLKKQVERWNGEEKIGHHFKMLAQQTKVYAQFLGNYPKALETLHKCTQLYPQFADLTGSIKLRTLKGQQQGQSLSLEDLLHKPVARVQKNCLSLQDLIKYTPDDHPDYSALNESLHMIQNFLNDYNVEHRGELYPHQERNQRHLVKNSFTVELSEGSRKLRHLFLFNDVLVCAKYKASGRGEKFTFQLKWYIPLCEVLIVEEPSSEPKETKPANLVALKTAASSLRDTIMQAERDEEWRGKGRGGGKNMDKHRKNLAELEAQLVLASPHLLFQVSSKSGKTFSIFLSSEYERSQWVEALKILQEKLPPNTSQAHNMSMVELQSWVTSCRKFLKTNMGSFLMRSTRDEPLLIGDLHLVLNNLGGLTRPADIFVVIEVDSYGHYFRKVKTRAIQDSIEPSWNDEFIIELEGSENVRILVYEETKGQGTMLRGKATLELSRSWLGGTYSEQRISMNDVMLTCQTKYLAFEETIRRVPTAKPTGLFKTSIQQTTKKEKRAVPFIITSSVREVERRGITEVGIYRVSGSATDMARLKRAYESNPYEAEQLLKECDVHAVAGILKQYLRDLPECIFTSEAYNKLFEAYSIPDQEQRSRTYLHMFSQLPQNPNQACVVFLIEHLVRVSQMEQQNKMSLHNLATVFGPTMLHAGPNDKKGMDILASSTVDVMAQSGILHYFLSRRARGEPIQILERTL